MTSLKREAQGRAFGSVLMRVRRDAAHSGEDTGPVGVCIVRSIPFSANRLAKLLVGASLIFSQDFRAPGRPSTSADSFLSLFFGGAKRQFEEERGPPAMSDTSSTKSVETYIVPVDPMDLLQCDSFQ